MEFLEYQTVMNHRIPVNQDGTLGKPQLVKIFSRAINNTRKEKPVPVVHDFSAEQGDDVEM